MGRPCITPRSLRRLYRVLIPGSICYGLEASRVQVGPGISQRAAAARTQGPWRGLVARRPQPELVLLWPGAQAASNKRLTAGPG